MTKKRKKIIPVIIFFIGFSLCLYPLVSNLIERQHQRNAVATYNNSVKDADDHKIEEELQKANEYNLALFQSGGTLIGEANEILSEESYNSLLNMTDTGIMANLEIPKINVSLPIYHGTSDEVLAAGVGHLSYSSFPIGGENTRAILTGHRGLPNSKLFTRLDELEEGDLFFINVFEKTLAYKVIELEVIEPDEIDKLSIQPGKDLVTLLTCTPYGINTHRLIVTGERVAYEESVKESIKGEMMSFREIVFICIPFVFLIVAIILIIKNSKKNKKGVSKHEIKKN